jgi:hypothetical protein
MLLCIVSGSRKEVETRTIRRGFAVSKVENRLL